MSIFIGKDNNSENILHFTCDKQKLTDMKNGVLSTTTFHSSRQYLTATQVVKFVPDYTDMPTVDTINMYSQYITYNSVDGDAIDPTKSLIMLAELKTKEYGTVVYSIGTAGTDTVTSGVNGTHDKTFLYTVQNITSTTIDLVHDWMNIAARCVVEDEVTTHKQIPASFTVIVLENSLTDVRSSDLTGELTINGNTGVSVGSTTFFQNHYLILRDKPLTVNADIHSQYTIVGAQYLPVDGDEITDTGLKYLYVTNKRAKDISIKLKDGTISYGVAPLIHPEFTYIRNTSSTSYNARSCFENATGIAIGADGSVSSTVTNRSLIFRLDGLNNLDSTSNLFVHLRFQYQDSDYFYVSGYFPYGETVGSYRDNLDVGHGASVIASFTKVKDSSLLYSNGGIKNNDYVLALDAFTGFASSPYTKYDYHAFVCKGTDETRVIKVDGWVMDIKSDAKTGSFSRTIVIGSSSPFTGFHRRSTVVGSIDSTDFLGEVIDSFGTYDNSDNITLKLFNRDTKHNTIRFVATIGSDIYSGVLLRNDDDDVFFRTTDSEFAEAIRANDTGTISIIFSHVTYI